MMVELLLLVGHKTCGSHFEHEVFVAEKLAPVEVGPTDDVQVWSLLQLVPVEWLRCSLVAEMEYSTFPKCI